MRIYEDLAVKLSRYCEIAGESVAQVLDPVIRPAIDRLYASVEKEAEKLEQKRKELEELQNTVRNKHKKSQPK